MNRRLSCVLTFLITLTTVFLLVRFLGSHMVSVTNFRRPLIRENQTKISQNKLHLAVSTESTGRRHNSTEKGQEEFQPPPPRSSAVYIDLDTYMPDVDELYKRLVVVTAFSQNHFKEAQGLIGATQRHMPGKKIIVYDLGMNEDTTTLVKQFCDVELREFPFDKYPDHVKNLLTYAWKPILINLTLNEFGVIYYGDASIRFKKSLKELLRGIDRHHGYMTVILAFDPKHHDMAITHHYRLTVPEMFVKLEIDRQEYYNSNYSAPHFQPGTQLVVNSTTIQTKLIQPWLQCALEKECITPEGSSRKNHRQDASAISLLAYKNMYREWTLEDNDTERMHKVIVVKRGDIRSKYHAQFCKTTS